MAVNVVALEAMFPSLRVVWVPIHEADSALLTFGVLELPTFVIIKRGGTAHSATGIRWVANITAALVVVLFCADGLGHLLPAPFSYPPSFPPAPSTIWCAWLEKQPLTPQSWTTRVSSAPRTALVVDRGTRMPCRGAPTSP